MKTNLQPQARFQIYSDKHQLEYLNFLKELVHEFFTSADKRNKPDWPVFSFGQNGQNGEEGGVTDAYLGETYIVHCKLHAFDGESPGNVEDWKGLLFRNHSDQLYKTPVILAICDAFSEFLARKGIEFKSFTIDLSHNEELRNQFSPQS